MARAGRGFALRPTRPVLVRPKRNPKGYVSVQTFRFDLEAATETFVAAQPKASSETGLVVGGRAYTSALVVAADIPSTINLRARLITTLDVSAPVFARGRPVLPVYSMINSGSSFDVTAGAGHTEVKPPKHPSVKPKGGLEPHYSWDAGDLSNPPTNHGHYNLSTWREHTNLTGTITKPVWESSGVWRPSVQDKVVYGSGNEYHTWDQCVHFDASGVEHMWIDMNSSITGPYTWVIAGMINYYPFKRYGHYLMDSGWASGAPPAYADPDEDTQIHKVGHRSLMLFQGSSALLGVHGKSDITYGKHIRSRHDELPRPRVFFGVFDDSGPNKSFVGAFDQWHRYGKWGTITSGITQRHFVLGRRAGWISDNLASHMTIFEIRYFNKALSAREIKAQYKHLAQKWDYWRYARYS